MVQRARGGSGAPSAGGEVGRKSLPRQEFGVFGEGGGDGQRGYWAAVCRKWRRIIETSTRAIKAQQAC